MVGLLIEVTSGNIKFKNDWITKPYPLGNGVEGKKYVSQTIDKINARSTFEFSILVRGGQYDEPSKIKLLIDEYSKEPAPDFSMEGVKEIPKTIKLPEGFMPKRYKNEPNR